MTAPPWPFAAVCVMIVALTLLVFGLTQVPVFQLLPGYAAAYLFIGACIFGPVGKLPSLRQAVAFLLPGALLVVVALLDFGFWCGGWLLGLPAWGPVLSRWTPENPLPAAQVLKFPGFAFAGHVDLHVQHLGDLQHHRFSAAGNSPHPAGPARLHSEAASGCFGGLAGAGSRGGRGSASPPGRVMEFPVEARRRRRHGRTDDRLLGPWHPTPLRPAAAQ